jgi:colanic acid biosynthesis glycosyl transferase WcaI
VPSLLNKSARKPRLTALYHYFHPDDVVSARHYADLCLGLTALGWEVEVLPCNRGCRDERKTYSLNEKWRGVNIRRVWRPPIAQASTVGRILNACWMIASWCCIAFRPSNRLPDVLLIGTDPIMSILVAAVVKLLRPRVRIVHWVFDLYPEALVADALLPEKSLLVRLLHPLLRRAYRSCDLIADLGPCMGERLVAYGALGRQSTLVPWAVVEPEAVLAPDPRVRAKLFGEARLAVLYAGNFGRAHGYEEFLELARAVRGSGIHFCFAVRGNRVQELKSAVGPEDTNVSFADFAAESELSARLAAADVHLASLRPGWTGVVVPSKFFGSLAAGRPVVFAGEPQSAIARWIRQYNVGWVLDGTSVLQVKEALERQAAIPRELHELQKRCYDTYQERFSRQTMVDAWDFALRKTISTTSPKKRVGDREDRRSQPALECGVA